MDLVAVCISKKSEQWLIPEIPFHCHTKGYEPILHHDNNDMHRVEYLTRRYNRAVDDALVSFPWIDNIMIVDSYYLPFQSEIRDLVSRYNALNKSILGASIWFWDRSHIRPCVRYYDTLSVTEMRRKKWYSLQQLPKGLLPVSGVGGCFIFPRFIWDATRGFSIPDPEPQAGGSRGLATSGYKILLDCDRRLWRTPADNPEIPDYPPIKRLRVSLGELRRRIIAGRGGT